LCGMDIALLTHRELALELLIALFETPTTSLSDEASKVVFTLVTVTSFLFQFRFVSFVNRLPTIRNNAGQIGKSNMGLFTPTARSCRSTPIHRSFLLLLGYDFATFNGEEDLVIRSSRKHSRERRVKKGVYTLRVYGTAKHREEYVISSRDVNNSKAKKGLRFPKLLKSYTFPFFRLQYT
ncbi:hypothetical protein ACHAWX_001727, partial [Stephanocyclus meneghinianus]